MKKSMIPSVANTLIVACVSVSHVFALFIAPLIYYRFPTVAWLFVLLSVVLTSTTWALIHEGIHGHLFINQRRNAFTSRWLSLLIHSNFLVLRFGHLMHHRFNRTDYELTEGVADDENYLLSSSVYYVRISGGLYWGEVLGPLLFLLPLKILYGLAVRVLGEQHPFVTIAEKTLLQRHNVNIIRLDCILAIIMVLSCIVLYATAWPLLLTLFLARGFIISASDNLPHYGYYRDVNSAYNLRAPIWLQYLLLNFNYHQVHHEHPQLPWSELPQQFNEEHKQFETSYLLQFIKQFNGVIPVATLNLLEKP